MHPSRPPLRILIAPLDWGLGHATRSIPVVQALLQKNVEIFLAGSGTVQKLLQAELPQLPFLELEGYNVAYSKSGWMLPLQMTAQLPKIAAAIRKEHQWLRVMQQKFCFDAVIADNRFGLWHPGSHNVFITHQLTIQAPLFKNLLQWWNYRQISRFTQCWIPDYGGPHNLTGALAHPQKMPPLPCFYLGPLSRFSAGMAAENHLLILLSGPEPQRSLLENLLLKELKHYPEPAVLVRGLPLGGKGLALPAHIQVYDHLPATQLAKLMLQAKFIISRSGYSTVMDLARLKKKAIFIPTPGQTEQEYLAQHLMKKNFALSVEQKKFKLKPALELASHFPYQNFIEETPSNTALRHAVNQLIAQIEKRRY